jgi:hypothetical protein
MDTRTQAVPPDVMQQFIDAIAGDNLDALQHLVQQHGTELNLLFRRVTDDGNGPEVTLDLDGTPLNMAATLQREALAVYLVERGAIHSEAVFTSDDGNGWDSHTVKPMEQATSFGMAMLTRALMNSATPVDWTSPGWRDRDDWPASRTTPGSFLGLLDHPDIMTFIGTTGLFRGLVDGHLVQVRATEAGFVIHTDGVPQGSFPTMADSLYAVRELLKVTAPSEDQGDSDI